MFRYTFAALIALLLPLQPVQAGDRSRLGFGVLITNDFLGDGRDRWRTGSVATSRVWGPEWDGALPQGFGDLIELRIGGQIIAPEKLRNPAPGDRPYAGAISIGAHTHYMAGKTEISLGGDLTFVGPATGLGLFQSALHDVLSMPQPSDAVLAAQIDNEIRPTLVLEMGRKMALGERTVLRPFVEAQAGAETFVRAGFDVTVGQFGRGEMMVRDNVSGHRYRTIKNEGWSGASFIVGADIAHVAESVYLPEDRGYAPTTRERVRAGLHVQGENGGHGFYGVTWLGEEFEGQDGGQLIGSFRFNLRF